MSAVSWILYGATGYTGELIAREAARRSLHPILAGRNETAIAKLARELSLDHRVFSLDKADEVAGGLAGTALVLNCAGPFSQTARKMIEGCLRSGTHYLDITGEIDAIETAAQLGERAKQAGICLLSAVGFDVVPSDCLAAKLAAALPGATHLQLAFSGLTAISPGTAKTMLESLPQGGRERIDGRIRRVPVAWKVKEIPFREGPRWAMTIPWGDVASAYYSTNIANIEVYAAAPRRQIKQARRWRFLLPLLKLRFLRRMATRWVDRHAARSQRG